jgi:hypothetical protein
VNLCFAGIKQEKSQKGPTRRTKKHILRGNQLEKTLEDTRRRPSMGGPLGIGHGWTAMPLVRLATLEPTYQPPSYVGPPLP